MNIDLEAIARHLNQSLNLNGIIGVTAKVSVNHDCLKIAMESVAVTKKDQLLPIIMREIAHFKLTSIKTVKIYGKQIKTNVKHDISKSEKLKRFIDCPEMVFDEDKLSQHKNHIQSHIKEYLNLDSVNIVPIHAQSGFLSTKSEYEEYSSQLWELSKIK